MFVKISLFRSHLKKKGKKIVKIDLKKMPKTAQNFEKLPKIMLLTGNMPVNTTLFFLEEENILNFH